MTEVEEVFDINRVLKNCYLALESERESSGTDIVFEMDTTIPRELKGEQKVVEQLLITLLSFVLKHSKQKEILLSLSAPEDFLFEEPISFMIQDTAIPKEKVLSFLETDLGNTLISLEGEVIYDSDADLHIEIPFTIGELGFRRHYRLPSKSMLQKKVLLIFEGKNVTRSVSKMFKYFPYDVTIGFREFQEDKNNLHEYDLVVIEDSLLTDAFSAKVAKAQEEKNLKFVILGNEDAHIAYGNAKISTHLMRPVTQESIFELIVSVFEEGRTVVEKKKIPVKEERETSLEKKSKHDIKIPPTLQNKPENSGLNSMIEEKKSKHVMILDTNVGLKNAKKNGLEYAEALHQFLETFDKSDLYFRQIVNEKQTVKIKDFCIDLEKQSKIIGAESMQKFADIVSLIFVYDKLDMLPIYPGRYHIELEKLTREIKRYLHI